MAGNATLDRFLETLICRTPLLSLARTGRGAYCGAHEHREIIEALARRDATAAARCMTAHLSALEAQLAAGAPAPMPFTLTDALAEA
jgi:DNA-binding GntR family transcriptional regulator